MKSDQLCACGCGERTNIDQKTGDPYRFVRYHHNRGKHNPRYGGGRIPNGYGYAQLKDRGHPRANARGYVLEHVVVAERALGKPLPVGAEVHHVNGDKSDNRPGNLVVCENHEYHMLLHARQRALEACGHADWRKCWICKRWDRPAALNIRGKRACHRECRNEYQRSGRRGVHDRNVPPPAA